MKRRGWGEAGAFNLGCLNDRSRIRRIGGYNTSDMDKLVRGIRGGLDSLSRAGQMSDTAQIIADLARVKATFQLRAIKAAMGWPYAVDLGASPCGDRALVADATGAASVSAPHGVTIPSAERGA